MAFDLAIPPLSLLVMIWGATFTIGLIALAFAASPWPLLLLALGGAALAVAILVGWWVHCWRVISFTSLLLAPLYALRKLPIYGSFLARRQQEWVRTARDASLGEKI